jgi:cysteine desulfurase
MSIRDYIYLDNNATTKLAKEALKAMLFDLKGPPYNPSSPHFFGRKANLLLMESRKKISSLLKVEEEEIIFTSSGSESLNLLINGFFEPKGHIITTDIEHLCVYETILNLQKKGADVTFLKTKKHGAVKKEDIENAIKKNTNLIVLSAVNSETGVKTDFEGIAKIAKKHKINFVLDGVALLTKKRFSMVDGISAVGFSSHKIHGPKGMGFAFLRKDSKINPLILGGAQEFKKRAGTENIGGILGMTKALELAYEHLDKNIKKMKTLRDFFEKKLSEKLPISINGEGTRICNVSNIAFKDVDAEVLLILLDQKKVLASRGSACSSKSIKVSRILINMGINKERAASSIRFSFCRYNTKKEVERAVKIIVDIVKNLV